MGGWLDVCVCASDAAGGKSVTVDSLLLLLNGACEPNKEEAVGFSSSSNKEETALLVLPPNSEDPPAFAATGAVAAGALGAFGTSSSLSVSDGMRARRVASLPAVVDARVGPASFGLSSADCSD